MNTYEFDAELVKHAEIDSAFIEFPYDVEKEFGTKGQVKVVALIDGYEYRGSLAKMGHPCHCLGMTQEVRRAIGKKPGDRVHVILKQDTKPRVVEVPADLSALLDANPDAHAFFESLSYTNRKEYARWISDAKKAETRDQRLAKLIRMLLNGVRHP